MNLFKLKPHPFSQILPNCYGQDYDHLKASVGKLRRLRFPIVVYENQILDGNQRLRACKETGVEPRYIEFKGNDGEALDLVWDLNIARRQLNASEKATAVAKATLMFQRGRPEKMGTGAHFTEKLAEKAGVGIRTVIDAKKVLRDGTDEEKAALESGKAKAKPLAAAIREREKAEEKQDGTADDNGTPVPKPALAY